MKKTTVMVATFAALVATAATYFLSKDDSDLIEEELPSHVLGQELHQIPEPMACRDGMLIEIFAYQCPHCWKLESYQQMLKDNSTTFAKIPTDLGRSEFLPYLKLNFIVDMMKLSSDLKHEAMRLYHEEGKRFTSDNAVIAWLAQQGVDPVEVNSIITSEQLQARIGLSRKLIRDAAITSVPTIIVNGRYVTSPHLAGGYDQFEAHLQALQKLPHTCEPAKTI